MMVPKVTAAEWFRITGRGHVASIFNVPAQIPEDFDLNDFLKTGAVIDGKYYRVLGVERQGHSRRNFGLLVGATR